MAKTDLLALYQNTFGYIALPFPLPPFSTEVSVAIPEYPDDIPVFEGNYYLQAIKVGDFEFGLEALVGLSGVKTVLMTAVSGLDGTVKEIISNGDYRIEIRGIIVNEDSDDYPEREVTAFRELCEANKAQPVEGDIFKLFNINQLVITGWQLPAEAGGQNYQAYMISGVSDRPVELTLTDPNNGLYLNP